MQVEDKLRALGLVLPEAPKYHQGSSFPLPGRVPEEIGSIWRAWTPSSGWHLCRSGRKGAI
jgi:hypothetical protein